MAIIKSFKDIVNSMLKYLHLQRPNVDTSPGTFTRDVMVDATANEMSSLYLDLNRISNAQSPDLAAVTDVEKLGKNFQLHRKGPIKATGIATFYSFEPPAETISIPRGTTIASKALPDGTAQQYTTTQDATLGTLDFNATTGRYDTDVPIRAVIAGTDANVPPGTISAMTTPISGVSGVYNYSTITNGENYEALSAFRKRLKSVLIGNNVGTADGYYQTIIRILNVVDAKVASADTGIEALRRNDAGAVDIYIRGLISTQAPIETYTVVNSAPYEYITAKQPIDLLAASSFILTGSVTGILTENVHYTIVQDTGKYGGSVDGADKFVFTGVDPGEDITIVFSYNSLVESLQIFMDDDSRKVLGTDLLIKGAKPRKINIGCTIRILPGYVESDIIAKVTLAVATFLDDYLIGEEVQQSDILAVIANIAGVDDVTVPLDTFEEDSTTGSLTQDASGNIIIPADSYAVVGNIIILVRV